MPRIKVKYLYHVTWTRMSMLRGETYLLNAQSCIDTVMWLENLSNTFDIEYTLIPKEG